MISKCCGPALSGGDTASEVASGRTSMPDLAGAAEHLRNDARTALESLGIQLDRRQRAHATADLGDKGMIRKRLEGGEKLALQLLPA